MSVEIHIKAKGPFVCADYVPDFTDTRPLVECDKHSVCPSFSESDSFSCHLVVKGYRRRKCGPSFDLILFFCRKHQKSFTVYPPGWLPYLRKDIEAGFEAVKNAAANVLWPEQKSKTIETRFTQTRWLKFFANLMGYALSSNDQAEISYKIGAVTNEFIEQLKRVREGPPWVGRKTWGECLKRVCPMPLPNLTWLAEKTGVILKMFRWNSRPLQTASG